MARGQPKVAALRCVNEDAFVTSLPMWRGHTRPMEQGRLMRRWNARLAATLGMSFALLSGLVVGMPQAMAQEKPVYRCPGNLYTDALSAKEASDKGCKTLDGAPITVIQSIQPRPAAPKSAGGNAGSNSGNGAGPSPEQRVSPEDQKARDTDARRILEAELRKEEDALAALRKEFNNGEPERQGNERNAQKYQDRVNEMRNALIRKEADVVSIKRELSKLGGAPAAGGSSNR
jgi:hypothetical protein